MPVSIRRTIPVALCAVSLTLLAGPAMAESRDRLSETRERLKIEAQRVEKDIHDGRMRAYRLLRTDPNEAFDIIKGLIGMLRKDTSLSAEKRETLMQALQRDVSSLRALANVRRTTDPVVRATQAEARRTVDPRVSSDRKSAADTASAQIARMSGRVADLRTLRDRTSERFTGTMSQVDRSAVPAASDYDFPPNWLERTKMRSPEAKLTAAEKAVLNGLKKPVKVDYNMDTFQSVIDHLSKQIGQNILVDKQSLEEAGITYDSLITLRFPKPVSARTALKRVLADVGLTYVIRNGTIDVTTIARAREMMTTRTYYIGDLIGIVNPMFSAIGNRFQAIQAIGMILSSIQAIDPESWQGRGGAGSVTFDPVRMALVVKQSAEMHYMLNGVGR